jgi:hypothetical protein
MAVFPSLRTLPLNAMTFIPHLLRKLVPGTVIPCMSYNTK